MCSWWGRICWWRQSFRHIIWVGKVSGSSTISSTLIPYSCSYCFTVPPTACCLGYHHWFSLFDLQLVHFVSLFDWPSWEWRIRVKLWPEDTMPSSIFANPTGLLTCIGKFSPQQSQWYLHKNISLKYSESLTVSYMFLLCPIPSLILLSFLLSLFSNSLLSVNAPHFYPRSLFVTFSLCSPSFLPFSSLPFSFKSL